MKFLYPAFLFALFAIIIPILIHLFSFRRFKTVWFSNVSYLLNIKKESQKKSRLKHLLILLSRIMAIASLVFLFAQPYIPSRNQQGVTPNPVISIYLDNSFSMNALSSGGQLLEVARNKALEIASAYPPGTRFRLITNDFLPQHRHEFNKEQFIQQISEVAISPRAVPLSLVNRQIASQMDDQEEGSGSSRITYYISDFQTETTDLTNFRTDSSSMHYLMPLASGISKNLYIDSCWMELPAHKIGQEENLNVRIVNASDEAYQNLPLKFFLNDTLKAVANFDIGPGEEKTASLKYMNLTGGIHLGRAEISDYPFVHDNAYFMNYKVQSNLQALAVYEEGNKNGSGIPYLKALFDGDDYVSLEAVQAGNLQVSKLAASNTIFILNMASLNSGLANELKKAAENGSAILFFPEPDGKVESYNNFLTLLNANTITRFDTARNKIAGIEWQHPIYEQVFKEKTDDAEFPEIRGNFVFSRVANIPETPLLWFRNEAKAASVQAFGNGSLVVFSFPLSGLNDRFARDVLFVPTLYSMVINSLPGQEIAYTIGQEQFATFTRQTWPEGSSLSVRNVDEGREFIPDITISEGNRLKMGFSDFFSTAGHYIVEAEGRKVAAISMNYDRRESGLRFLTPDDLRSAISKYGLKNCFVIDEQERNFSDILDEIQTGKKLWKLFLVLALLFLVAEALIIRFWK
jgi:hypothetical protein